MEELYSLFQKCKNVCTDTRLVKSGDIFFALKGAHFNGNQFAQKALELGASYAVIDEKEYALNNKYILVEDVLQTLQNLAKHHRSQFNIPVIAITGSNGKTTTKELMAAVLMQKYRVHYTKGNLNNHIGIPITLLQMKKETEIAIIEMGANHQKEIDAYCKYVLPGFGLITNIGSAHLEGFGGEEGVEKAKTELFAHLNDNRGIIFYNSDSEKITRHITDKSRAVSYGKLETDFVSGEIKRNAEFLQIAVSYQGVKMQIQTNLSGSYNFENVLAAICIGLYFNIGIDQVQEGIANYIPENKRSQVLTENGNTFILDYYNANPNSMEAALQNLSSQKAVTKIAVLGDMLELGDYAKAEHKKIFHQAVHGGLDKIIFIGPEFMRFKNESTPQKLQVEFFNSAIEAKSFWQSLNIQNALILLKGSRGISVEKILIK